MYYFLSSVHQSSSFCSAFTVCINSVEKAGHDRWWGDFEGWTQKKGEEKASTNLAWGKLCHYTYHFALTRSSQLLFWCLCSFILGQRRITNKGLHSEPHSMPSIQEQGRNIFSSFVPKKQQRFERVYLFTVMQYLTLLLFCAMSARIKTML